MIIVQEKKLPTVPVFVVLIVLTVSSWFGLLNRPIQAIGLSTIHGNNVEYLQDSFDKSVRGFVVLSAIKSGVSVIEGSSFFGVEVGDVVQPIYNFVDVAWRTALAGGVVLLLMRLILETLQSISHYFLTATFFFATILYTGRFLKVEQKKLYRVMKELFTFVICLTVAVYILIPVSIAGASALSRQITQPLIDEAQAGFESQKDDFTLQSVNERLSPRSEDNISIRERLNLRATVATPLRRLGDWFDSIARDFALWTIKLVTGYLFDSIVFPIGFFAVTYILTKMLLSSLLGVSRNQTMKEEFENIVKKIYHTGKNPDAENA